MRLAGSRSTVGRPETYSMFWGLGTALLTRLTNRSSNMLTDQPAFDNFVSLVLANKAGNKAVNFGHALLRHLAAQPIWRKLFRQNPGRNFSSVVTRFVCGRYLRG